MQIGNLVIHRVWKLQVKHPFELFFHSYILGFYVKKFNFLSMTWNRQKFLNIFCSKIWNNGSKICLNISLFWNFCIVPIKIFKQFTSQLSIFSLKWFARNSNLQVFCTLLIFGRSNFPVGVYSRMWLNYSLYWKSVLNCIVNPRPVLQIL